MRDLDPGKNDDENSWLAGVTSDLCLLFGLPLSWLDT